MEKDEIFYKRLAEIMDKPEGTITGTTDLTEVYLDSLAILALLALLDELYNKVFSVEQLKGCKCAEDVLEFIKAAQ